MTKEIEEKVKEAAKEFCKTCPAPHVTITSTEYSLAGLVSFHEGARFVYSLLTPSGDVQERAKEMQWVKASERMPAKEGRTVVKRLRECMMADATLRNDGSMVFTTPNNMTWNRYKEFEWLDESGASSMQAEVERLKMENHNIISRAKDLIKNINNFITDHGQFWNLSESIKSMDEALNKQ